MTKLRTDEEVEKEFDEKFPCIDSTCDGKGNCNPHKDEDDNWIPDQCEFCFKYRFPMESFIYSLRKEDMRVVREMIKGKEKYIEEGFTGKYSRQDIGYNKALDDIIQALSSLEREGK